MRLLPWIVATAGLGLAAYVVLTRSEMAYATERGGAGDPARTAFGWGTKQRASGIGGQIAGRWKQGVGRLTGNDDLAAEGVADEAVGAAKDAAGNVAQAVGETINEFNR
jgi:uncharacterized protein YjbJ (UPF0337 family)